MLRITQRSMADATYANLQASLARSASLQEQLSSGKQVSKPSDNPTAATDILQLRAERSATDQFVRNADNGVSWLTTADTALQQTSDAVRRARDLTVQGGNGALNQVGRDAIAKELRAVRETLVGLGNTQYLGRPVFGGTTAGGAAFDATGAYVGDDGTVARRVGTDSTVRVDVDGRAAFGDGASSVFAALDAIIADLASGASPSARLDALDAAHERVLGALADVGARTNRIETLKARATDAAISLRSAQSQVEDVDLPATILELQLQSTAYQAALGATARVLQPTLLDFLR
jgi:flagellar hook-associated protein 3 FlgL